MAKINASIIDEMDVVNRVLIIDEATDIGDTEVTTLGSIKPLVRTD